MTDAAVFSGESPSQIAKVTAEKISTNVMTKRAIRMICESILRQSSGLCDELQAPTVFGIHNVFRASVGIEAVVSTLLANLQ